MLDEYIATLSELKQKYAEFIQVHIGLEIEYFPSFDQYYKELKSMPGIEILLLGQHMAEIAPGEYTFAWNVDMLDKEEYIVLGNAQVEGMLSHYFDVVAHPDRIFRRQTKWSADMDVMAERIINTAVRCNMPLEINESSKRHWRNRR